MSAITPKPPTVYDLFNGHPERWSKGSFALDHKGIPVSPDSLDAVRWDLLGAIRLLYPRCQKQILHRLGFDNRMWMQALSFNDAPSTTFDMMLAKVKEAGI